MNADTDIGPSRAMRRRISASSGVRSSAITWAITGPSRMQGLAPQREAGEPGPGDEQRYAQQHAHGGMAPQETELGVGLAEELAERAHHGVEHGERSDDEAGAPQRAGPDHDEKNDQQGEPFEAGLVELARMARQRPAERKYHRPRHVGGPSPQLAIDEVREPPEQEPDRPDRAGDVAERERRYPAVVSEAYHRDDATEKAAVEGHAAFPHLEDLERVLEKMRQVVEQHIAGAAA